MASNFYHYILPDYRNLDNDTGNHPALVSYLVSVRMIVALDCICIQPIRPVIMNKNILYF